VRCVLSEVHIPKSGFDFLKKLKRNNNREWFLKNKELYEESLKLPLQQVIVDLGDLLASKTPGIQFNPKKSIFRINRDVRFSNNKDPYKTNIGASFTSNVQHRKEEHPGLYLHIEPGNCFIGGGLYMPSGEQIRKIRELIQKDPQEFKKIINSPQVKKYFGGLTGEKLKRAPKGISEDHPHIELLRWKQFVYIKHFKDADFQKERLAKVVYKEYVAMMPLVNWLNKAMSLW
jgi:uncharacterized protein (TIGR02453 family)